MRSRGVARALLISIAGLAVTPLPARAAVLVEGYVRITIVEDANEIDFGRSDFSLTTSGDDWSLVNAYPGSGIAERRAFLDGKAIVVTLDPGTQQNGAGVLNSLKDLLDSTSEFARLPWFAFRFLDASQATNTPVPFLDPRHPALYGYDLEIEWSDVANRRHPEVVKFVLSPVRVDGVSRESLDYYYRERSSARREWNEFIKSQQEPARYYVLAWTNSALGEVPQTAVLDHTYYKQGRTALRRHFLVVTNVASDDARSVLPSLQPGTYVQHLVGGTNYAYTASNGVFRSDAEAVATGEVLRKAERWTPPPERRQLAFIKLVLLAAFLLPLLGLIIYRRRSREH